MKELADIQFRQTRLLQAADFENHGSIETSVVLSRQMDVASPGKSHLWLREHCNHTALFTQLAIVAGPAT